MVAKVTVNVKDKPRSTATAAESKLSWILPKN